MKLDYSDGYAYGQHDALTWLSEPRHEKDHPLAAFEERVHLRASMVCLARNLRDAACAQLAFCLGVSVDDESMPLWMPGRKKLAPGWSEP